MRAERVAIVGSRTYPCPHRVYDFVDSLPVDTVVVSGGAPGVDTWAENAAWRRGLARTIHVADWEKHGHGAGLRRNSSIVTDADRLVAFWDGKSPGTADTIRKARAIGIPVEVIGIEPEVTR